MPCKKLVLYLNKLLHRHRPPSYHNELRNRNLYLEITNIYPPTPSKHRARLYIELSVEKILIDTGPHNTYGKFYLAVYEAHYVKLEE